MDLVWGHINDLGPHRRFHVVGVLRRLQTRRLHPLSLPAIINKLFGFLEENDAIIVFLKNYGMTYT